MNVRTLARLLALLCLLGLGVGAAHEMIFDDGPACYADDGTPPGPRRPDPAV